MSEQRAQHPLCHPCWDRSEHKELDDDGGCAYWAYQMRIPEGEFRCACCGRDFLSLHLPTVAWARATQPAHEEERGPDFEVFLLALAMGRHVIRQN